MKVSLVLLALFCFTTIAHAQRCDSIAASGYGGWKPIKSAPRDGTIVELLETYGVAPWYGLFSWKAREFTTTDGKGVKQTFKYSEKSWVRVGDENSGVSEDECLFWRPYKGTGKYTDPTNGAQNSVAYWCAYMHRPYNKKKDACE